MEEPLQEQDQANPTSIYRAISQYPFDQDSEYQAGLAAILGHPETPATNEEIEQESELVIRAKCFYFIRRFNVPATIDPDAYSTWLLSQKVQAVPHDYQPDHQMIASSQSAQQISSAQASQPSPSSSSPTKLAQASSTQTQILAASSSQSQRQPPLSQTPSTSISSSTPATESIPPAATPAPPATATATAEQPQYPTSFAAIVELITRNIPVPGIEEIPTTVLEPGSSKVDKTPRRRKPWEKDDDDDNDIVDLNNGDGGGGGGDSVDGGQKAGSFQVLLGKEDKQVSTVKDPEASTDAETWIDTGTTDTEGRLSSGTNSGVGIDDSVTDRAEAIGPARSFDEDDVQPKLYTHDNLTQSGIVAATGKINGPGKTAQGVVNILKPNAIPDSGLLAKE